MSTNFPEEPIVPSDWISQSEAAELRGVSRQAISKLVRNGRLRTLQVGGHTLVHRHDLLTYRPKPAGRRPSEPGR